MRKILLLIFILSFQFINAQEIARLDINSLISSGKVTATVNCNFDIGNLSNVFDNNTGTLARSPNVNPVVITLNFTNFQKIVSSKAMHGAANGKWMLEVANTLEDMNNMNNSYSLIFSERGLTADVWDSIGFTPVIAKVLRLTMHRTSGDNYVHIREWQIYTENIITSLSLQPKTANVYKLFLQKFTLKGVNSYGDTVDLSSNATWSSSNNYYATVYSSGTFKGENYGSVYVKASYQSMTDSSLLNIIVNPNSPDLSVKFIRRLPLINYVENSTNPKVEGWPQVGQNVTWRAWAKNWKPEVVTAVPYVWKVNGAVVQSGTIDIARHGIKAIDLVRTWSFNREVIEFIIDPDNIFAEVEEQNNSLAIYSDAISLNLYVEYDLYFYFHFHQRSLGVHTNNFEDWAQSHVRKWNKMCENAIFPITPNGVLDRIRIDTIAVVPNGSLPLVAGGVASNSPNLNDKTCDLQWGFTNSLMGSFYNNWTDTSLSNPFFYEGSLLHELGHARYLIDLYGFNIHDNGTGNTVGVQENGNLIVGTSYLPMVSANTVHLSNMPGIMNSSFDYYGERTYIDEYSAAALNLIAGHRATKGNYNAPGNIGVFLNDLPDQNRLIFKSKSGALLKNASIKIYKATLLGNGWYNKYFDNTPDGNYTTDDNGAIIIERCPFSNDGTITHGANGSNGVILVRIEYQGAVDYVFFESWRCNLEYWKGNTTLGQYNLTTDIVYVGTNELDNYNFEVYPNPATKSLIINSQSNNYKIEIFCINGTKVFEKINCTNNEKIDIQIFEKGIYILKISNADYNIHRKIIFE